MPIITRAGHGPGKNTMESFAVCCLYFLGELRHKVTKWKGSPQEEREGDMRRGQGDSMKKRNVL